jgi:hypothetical protein
MNEKCENCRFWKQDPTKELEKIGWCRYWPPEIFEISGAFTSRFPLVKPEDWCGQYQLVQNIHTTEERKWYEITENIDLLRREADYRRNKLGLSIDDAVIIFQEITKSKSGGELNYWRKIHQKFDALEEKKENRTDAPVETKIS